MVRTATSSSVEWSPRPTDVNLPTRRCRARAPVVLLLGAREQVVPDDFAAARSPGRPQKGPSAH
eukprot:2202738-Pyramimonas_sp.AAC.1